MQKMISTRDMDWKQWNLRIPLVVFLFGVTAALYQSFPNLFLVESSFFVSAQYIGGIVLLFMLFEKIGLNQMKIHFACGILIILTGLLMDRIFI
ncbi:hypothetical protein MHZ95_00720 [Sporosarcina sp. ACRSM]|uniref:hypothetical protein n=1 Tax=Sporosarcina sp. ACRSM TaxID=2918216 RepID=UPI001EF53878|nr:hypothetical protein [Sporosarcina sp. ACRSM]MCG7333792.1 hypothetical protein [Sporosarcina sp. ACRSM]